MNLFFRFIILILSRLRITKPLDIFDPCTSTFLVNPMDLDLNMHMNNGRYLSIMDLGRFDLMLRAGVFWTLIKKGCAPIVSSETIRFRKSLGPFEKFDLITQIESWDEKDFYITQKFMRNGDIYAEGYVKGRFIQRGKGSLPTSDAFHLIGKEYNGINISERSTLQRQIEATLAKQNQPSPETIH